MSFDFDQVTSPFRMQPGLRRIGEGERQLTANARSSRALREKVAVMAAFRSQALLSLPGFDARPALQALCRQARQDHPDAFEGDADHAMAKHFGWSYANGQLHCAIDADTDIAPSLATLPAPWRLTALLSLAFAEDFAVLRRDGTVPWLSVCLPSSWAPETKLGLHFSAIHEPVADSTTLRAAADHLSRLVTGEEPWQRHVWTITRHPRLHAHPDRTDPAPWPADANATGIANLAYLRSERQTFIPVPGHDQAVFTIRVEVEPLVDAVNRASSALALHAALASMSDAVLHYRGLTDARDRLLAWLRMRADALS